MTIDRRVAAVAVAAGLALGLSACGGQDAESTPTGGEGAEAVDGGTTGDPMAAESASDEAATDDGGQIGIDSDGVTLEDENYSATVGGSQLPEWFPAGMPLPAEYTIVSHAEETEGDATQRMMSVTTPLAFDELVTTIDDGVAAAGYEVVERSLSQALGMDQATYQLSVDGEPVMLMVSMYAEDADLMVMYSFGELV